MLTRVINLKYKEPFDVYIGRPSKWGNPFYVEKYGQEGAVKMHIEWLLHGMHKEFVPVELNNMRLELLREIPIELKDKTLGCFYKPKPCHGDTLAWIADNS